MEIFSEVKNKFGFGCMRFPILENGNIDLDQVMKMTDLFLSSGFNYFDTAHGYLDKRSETTIKKALTERYPRSAYILADKLSGGFFSTREDIEPFFLSQLDACGVSYFDYYLMHAQSSRNYEQYQKCKAYETAHALKEKGLIRHLGISFHDSPEFLRKILSEHPEVEFVQLQLNYLDWEDEKVQAKACYEVCVESDKPVIVMEPVKGGILSSLMPEAEKEFKAVDNGSAASHALRFAASLENVALVLSGMSSMAQMEDNLRTMADFKAADQKELEAIRKVVRIIREKGDIACTLCHYCTEACPKHIPIPEIFSLMNKESAGKKDEGSYDDITKGRGRASSCIKCGKCEKACPQMLPIRSHLARAKEKYETSE